MDITRTASGFTLVELMVVITLLSILASIAIPSFDDSLLNSRLTSQSNRILAALQFARSEAATRGSSITICGSRGPKGPADLIDPNGPPTCDQPDWSTGFVVMDGNVLLHIFDPLEGGNYIRGTGQIIFDRQGTIVNVTQMNICDSRGVGSARGIRINGAGQARIGDPTNC